MGKKGKFNSGFREGREGAERERRERWRKREREREKERERERERKKGFAALDRSLNN